MLSKSPNQQNDSFLKFKNNNNYPTFRRFCNSACDCIAVWTRSRMTKWPNDIQLLRSITQVLFGSWPVDLNPPRAPGSDDPH